MACPYRVLSLCDAAAMVCSKAMMMAIVLVFMSGVEKKTSAVPYGAAEVVIG